METIESITLGGGRITIDAAELDKINSANPTAGFTLQDVEDKRLYAVEAVLVDSQPTRNRREYPAAWQESILSKWIGTKLVYSEDDHKPNAPDHVGWIYSSSIENVDGKTQTVARFAIPVITDTTRLVERLRSGLNHAVSIAVNQESALCKDCGNAVSPNTGRCITHAGAVTVMSGNGSPIHVALVGDPGCAGAGIRATSESFRVVETFTVQDDHTTMLVEDAKKLRMPIITEAVKYARLNKPETDKDQLTTRFERWTCEEIAEYRDSQKENYLLRNPTATKQLSYGGEIAEPVKQRWVALGDILKRLNDGGE